MTQVEVFKNLKSPKYPQFVNLQAFMGNARELGLNYIFVNKDTLDSSLLDEIKQAGYSIIIEDCKIKISW